MKNERFRIYESHYKANFSLALPVIFSQAGQMIVALTDNLMVGRLGAAQLAAVALANNIFVVGMMFGLGLITGLTPLAGKAIGAKNRLEATGWLKQAVITHPVSSLLLTGVMAMGVLIMPHMGQAREVVELALPYYLVLVSSIIPLNIFFLYKQYAEALGNTHIAMAITLISGLLNVFFNYLLIYGKLGFPAYGIVGAGYATLISRIFMAVAAIFIFFRMDFFKPDRINWKLSYFKFRQALELLKIGLPIGGQYIIEMLAFSIGSFMMGWLGTKELAAHQIVMSLVSLTYMISSGMASATTIKVSHFRGQHKLKAMNRAIYASIHMVLFFMLFSLSCFIIFRYKIPGLFVQDAEVISIAAGLMLIAGMFQLFDGLQVTLLGALRGMEDVRIPTILLIIAYFVVALPTSYLAAFVFDMGTNGVWLGYLVGLFLVSVQLFIRYRWKVKKMS